MTFDPYNWMGVKFARVVSGGPTGISSYGNISVPK